MNAREARTISIENKKEEGARLEKSESEEARGTGDAEDDELGVSGSLAGLGLHDGHAQAGVFVVGERVERRRGCPLWLEQWGGWGGLPVLLGGLQNLLPVIGRGGENAGGQAREGDDECGRLHRGR